MNFYCKVHRHKRLNILTGEWVMVSPHRTRRPRQGRTEALAPDNRPSNDPPFYLCPRNNGADGLVNADCITPFSSVIDFSVLLNGTPPGNHEVDGLLKADSLKGICNELTVDREINYTVTL